MKMKFNDLNGHNNNCSRSSKNIEQSTSTMFDDVRRRQPTTGVRIHRLSASHLLRLFRMHHFLNGSEIRSRLTTPVSHDCMRTHIHAFCWQFITVNCELQSTNKRQRQRKRRRIKTVFVFHLSMRTRVCCFFFIVAVVLFCCWSGLSPERLANDAMTTNCQQHSSSLDFRIEMASRNCNWIDTRFERSSAFACLRWYGFAIMQK